LTRPRSITAFKHRLVKVRSSTDCRTSAYFRLVPFPDLPATIEMSSPVDPIQSVQFGNRKEM
jgi:hypothetical protein